MYDKTIFILFNIRRHETRMENIRICLLSLLVDSLDVI